VRIGLERPRHLRRVAPCHRVIAAHGRLGGFPAPGSTALKRRRLALESARPDGPSGLFDTAA
jgi:hypothetical protein